MVVVDCCFRWPGRTMVRVGWLLLAAMLLIYSPARADDAAAGSARAAFERGVQASEESDWVSAEAQFAASCRALPKASSLFNLAFAQVQLGRGKEALATLDAFDEMAEPGLHAHLVARARALRLEAKSVVTQARLRELERTLAQREAQPARVPEAKVPQAPPRPSRRISGALVGVGATLSVGAAAFGFWWKERSDELSRCRPSPEKTCRQERQIVRQRRAAMAATLTAASLGPALTLMGSMLLRRGRARGDEPTLAVGLRGLTLRVRY